MRGAGSLAEKTCDGPPGERFQPLHASKHETAFVVGLKELARPSFLLVRFDFASAPVAVPAMSSSDNDAGARRSGRKRVSTIVKIDGYDVLVKNNYVVKGMAYHTDAYTADAPKKKPKTQTNAGPKKPPSERKVSPAEAARTKHNEAVKATVKKKESYRRDFLVKHKEILEPFMDDHTRRMVQQWTESKPSSSQFHRKDLFAQP